MYHIYAKKLGLLVRKTNNGAQKIDGSTIAMFRMVIATFLINDKEGKVRFFEKAFLLANISSDIVLRMLFFTLSNANVRFLE